MPKYAVAVEGSEYEVEAPDEQTAWNWAVYTHQNEPKPTPKSGFMPALEAGYERLKGEAALTAGKVGLMDTAAAEQYQKEQEAKAKGIFKPTEEGWTEAPVTKFKELLGGSLPYMAAPLAAAGAAAALPVTGPAAVAAAGAGAGLASLGQFTGSNLARQMETGKTLEETDLGAAATAAIPQAALDVVSFRSMPLIRNLFKSIGKELTEAEAKAIAEQGFKRTVADYALSGAKTATIEGATEAGQQFFERLQAGLSIDDEEARKEYVDNFIGGAVLGGAISPVGRFFERGREQALAKQQLAVPTEAPRLGTDELTALQTQYTEAEAKLAELAAAAKAPGLDPEARRAAVEEFLRYKNGTFAPLRLEYMRNKRAIDALAPAAPEAPTPEPLVTLPPTAPEPTAVTPPAEPTIEPGAPPAAPTEPVVTLPPQEPVAAEPTAEPTPAEPTPAEPVVTLPPEPVVDTTSPPPISEGPKSPEPPAAPVEPPPQVAPPERKDFEAEKSKEQIAKEVQGMTVPELARWAVLNAPNTPAKEIATKVFDRINEYASRGMFPGKIRVQNGGARNTKGVRGALSYRGYPKQPERGYDLTLRLNGLDEKGRADIRSGTRYPTILHELLHGAAYIQIEKTPNSPAVKELKNLYSLVKARVTSDINKGVKHPALDAIRGGANTMADVHELVSWGLTDHNFQNYLSTIKVGEKTAFTKFVELMRKLLDISPQYETALDSLMRSSENLLSTPVTEIETEAGFKLKGLGSRKGKPAQPVTLPPAAPKEKSLYETAPSEFPTIDEVPRVPFGPTTIQPKGIAKSKPLYHETNVEGLDDLLRDDRQVSINRRFVADNKDIAIGQGMNKGVMITFRPDSLSGRENVKPGTGDIAGREYQTDVVAPRAISSIEISQKDFNRLRGLTKRLLQDFDKTDLGKGKLLFTRKGYAPKEQVLYETAERAPKTDTPAFKRWFGDSKIVDEDGNPLVVYHGTKRDFNVFETKYPDGLFFFSTNPSFASKWPVGTGGKGDLREPPPGTEEEYNRIKKVEKRLYSQYMKPSDNYDLNTKEGQDQFDSDRASLKAAVKKETGFSSAIEFEMNAGIRVMPVYLSIQKPFDPRKDFKKIEPFLAKAGKQNLIDAGYHKSGNWVIYEDKGVIDELKRQGYDGIWLAENIGGPHETIAAFSNKQIKSAIGNIGTYGPTEVITEERTGDVGRDAVRIIDAMGMGVQPPAPSAFQRGKEILKNAGDNPKLTIESAKKSAVGFLDRIETSFFSSSSAFDNELRRQMIGDLKQNEDIIGALIDASQSQAVHADALASQFIIEGGLKYDPEAKKWVAYKEPDNFVELGKQLNAIAAKYGITEDESRRVAHTYFVAKRLKSLQERNEKDKKDIEALKAKREAATTKAEKEKLSSQIQRLKDREAYIHLGDTEIEAGIDLGEMIPELKDVTDTWNGIRRNVRRVLVNSGLWTEEYADQMLDVIDYVPFYREVQLEENKGPREFVRGLQVQAKEHQLKGSNQPVNDVIDNMVRWTQYAVNRSVRNDKAVRMVDAALGIDMIDGTKMAERVDEAKRGMNVVRVWRDGKQELYNMADPLFADAFTGIQNVAIEEFKLMSKVANTLRDSVVLFPLFSFAQVPQDAYAAMFSSGLQPQFALKIPYLAVKEFIKTMNKSSATHEILKKYGAVGVRDFNSTVVRDDAEIFAGLKAPLGTKAKIKEKLQHIAMSADNAVRQAVYEASLQQGLSKAEALEKAFEIINFRRRGTNRLFQIFGQTVPFFYAYLAAMRVSYKTLTGAGISPQERAAGLKTFAYTSAAVMTLSTLYAMLAGDDEDYKKTPAGVRDRTLTIPGTGGMRIPLRVDFFLLPKIVAEHTYLLLTDKGYEDSAKFRKSVSDAIADAVLSPTVVPQAVKPLVEVGINYDFFQKRPVVGTFEKQKELSRQFNEYTSEFSKLVGQTNMVSPIALDHLIRGMTGSVGGLFLWFTNQAVAMSNPTIERPASSTRELIEALPGTSGFLSRTNESALKNDFYQLRDEVMKAVNTFNDIKKNSPEGIDEFIKDEKRMAQLIVGKQVANVNQHLARLRAQIRMITQMPATQMSAEKKAEAIKELRKVEEQILESVNVKGMREKAQI